MSFENNSYLSRRRMLQAAVLAGIGAALPDSLLAAARQQQLIYKTIPSTGEKVPVIGVGTNQFGTTDYTVVCDVLKRMNELGGTVIDTAALYGESEVQIGKALTELGLTRKMFICTKFNAPGVGRDPVTGMDSIERSFQRLQKVDLMFIHQISSVEVMMPMLQDLKKQGRVRYIGITNVATTPEYPRLAEYMRKYPVDFIQVPYSMADRTIEQEILPLAQQRKIAVQASLPFGGGRNLVFNKVGDRQLPKWAADYGINSWGQFFLKYVISHPAIIGAIPGSTKVSHLEDNQAAGLGRLPNARMRRRMEEFWDGKA